MTPSSPRATGLKRVGTGGCHSFAHRDNRVWTGRSGPAACGLPRLQHRDPAAGLPARPCPAIPGQEPLPTRAEPHNRTATGGNPVYRHGEPAPPQRVPAGSGKGQGPFRQGQHGRHGLPFKPRYRAAARRRPAASPQAGLPVPCRPGPSPRPARRAHSPGPPGAHPGAGRRARSSGRPGPGTPWRPPTGTGGSRRARFRHGVRWGGPRPAPGRPSPRPTAPPGSSVEPDAGGAGWGGGQG